MAAKMFDDRLRIRRYTMCTPKISGRLRLVLLADLHGCMYGENQQELLREVAALAPDAVLLGGDLVNSGKPFGRAAAVAAKELAKRFPCFAVMGNNENRSGRAKQISGLLRCYGVQVLAGEGAIVRLRGQRVAVCGVDDFPSGKKQLLRQIYDAAKTTNPNLFRVLLVHRPERIHRCLPYGFDLVLAGHAHGGQWRIPGIAKDGLWAPGQGMLPRYAGGMYNMGETAFVVSRGLSGEKMRVPRLFNPPEIAVVDVFPNSGAISQKISLKGVR